MKTQIPTGQSADQPIGGISSAASSSQSLSGTSSETSSPCHTSAKSEIKNQKSEIESVTDYSITDHSSSTSPVSALENNQSSLINNHSAPPSSRGLSRLEGLTESQLAQLNTWHRE